MESEKKREVESREWVLSSYVQEGLPTSEHLKIQTVRLEVGAECISEGHVAVQILWLSVHPYRRTMMSGHQDGLYLPQYHLNQPCQYRRDVMRMCALSTEVRTRARLFRPFDHAPLNCSRSWFVSRNFALRPLCAGPVHREQRVASVASLSVLALSHRRSLLSLSLSPSLPPVRLIGARYSHSLPPVRQASTVSVDSSSSNLSLLPK